jgi:outer membrane lipoprotein
MKFIPILFSSLLVLGGCASYPEPVRVSDEASLVSFQATVKAGLTQGQARWSGVIAKVQNNSQNTRLEIVYFPSGTHGRPITDKDTEGRFVAYAKGFLDPVVYQPGKQVTVLGQLSPFEAGKVDQFQYSYPVIQASAVYLWPKQRETTRVDVEPWPMWRGPYPYWGYGPAIRIRTTTPTGATQTQGPADVQQQDQGLQQR